MDKEKKREDGKERKRERETDDTFRISTIHVIVNT